MLNISKRTWEKQLSKKNKRNEATWDKTVQLLVVLIFSDTEGVATGLCFKFPHRKYA